MLDASCRGIVLRPYDDDSVDGPGILLQRSEPRPFWLTYFDLLKKRRKTHSPHIRRARLRTIGLYLHCPASDEYFQHESSDFGIVENGWEQMDLLLPQGWRVKLARCRCGISSGRFRHQVRP